MRHRERQNSSQIFFRKLYFYKNYFKKVENARHF
ncbi:MAG: hypothetical protein RL757_133 [Bacteroidota bacterium]|jgi:hypothetical protein